MSERTTINFRVRLNGRLPDPDGKYRDEITQEATIELEVNKLDFGIIAQAEREIDKIHDAFYSELNRLGGYNYQRDK